MYPSRIGQGRGGRPGGSGSGGGPSQGGGSRVCQKCLKPGHATFECKNARPYVPRPTRSQAFNDPKIQKKLERNMAVKPPEAEDM